MTTHHTTISRLFFALLCITTTATAQQRSATENAAKQASEAPRIESPAMQRMTSVHTKQKGRRAQNTPLDITEVTANKDIDRSTEVPRNGHFASSGTVALIPVGRPGWHEISDWREIRRAHSAR